MLKVTYLKRRINSYENQGPDHILVTHLNDRDRLRRIEKVNPELSKNSKSKFQNLRIK